MQKKLRVFLFLAMFVLSVFFLVDTSYVLSSLSGISLETGLFACCLYFIFYLINAKILIVLLNALDFKVSLFSSLGISQLSSLFNYVVPFRVGQFAVKTTLMKVLFNVSISASSITFVVISLLSIFSSVALFLFSAFYLDNPYFWDNYSKLVFLFFFIIATTVTGIYATGSVAVVKNKVQKMLIAISSFSLGLVSLCIGLLLIQVFVSSLITIVFLEGVGVHLDLVTAIFLSSVGNITLLVSITPGNLGTKELTFVGVGMLLGVPESPMLAALIADRVLQIIISAIISTVLLYRHGGTVLKALKLG